MTKHGLQNFGSFVFVSNFKVLLYSGIGLIFRGGFEPVPCNIILTTVPH